MVRGGGDIARKIAVAFGASFVMLLMLAQPVSAGMSTITDPSDDAGRWFNKNKAIPAYVDIEGATLDLIGDDFVMTMNVAGAIPDESKLLLGIQTLAWQWGFRTGGGSHQLSHSLITDEDYLVSVMWDGKAWSTQLWDFVNPGSGFFLVWDIETFDVVGDVITVTIDSSLMSGVTVEWEWAVQVRGYMPPPLVTDGFAAAWWFDVAGINDDGVWTSWIVPSS